MAGIKHASRRQGSIQTGLRLGGIEEGNVRNASCGIARRPQRIAGEDSALFAGIDHEALQADGMTRQQQGANAGGNLARLVRSSVTFMPCRISRT